MDLRKTGATPSSHDQARYHLTVIHAKPLSGNPLIRVRVAVAAQIRMGESRNNRRAKFYSLTAAGRKELTDGKNRWHDVIAGTTAALRATGESL